MKLIKKLLCLAAALCILLSLLPTAFAEEGDERFRDKTWEEVVEAFMAEHGTDPDLVAFGYYNTVTGEEHYHRGDEYMITGSMFKVPLNMLYTEKVARGEIDWDTKFGGIAYSKYFTQQIIDRVGFIAPVTVLPGENEMQALAQGALRVLNGEETARIYG